ncbi:MAG TPA: hypothetical protein VF062_02240 [Candidatus Limnocylindrales bacterium]
MRDGVLVDLGAAAPAGRGSAASSLVPVQNETAPMPCRLTDVAVAAHVG